MSDGSPGMRWGIEQRLEFIEFRLYWEGAVNRSHIINAFGVSVPQASKDLATYQDVAPGNAVYDKSAKRYVPGPEFFPRFLKDDPDTYLSRLRSVAEGLTLADDSWIGQVPSADIALTPRREIEVGVLRAILAAIRDQQSLDIHYQSMSRNRPDPVWRRITPHAFGYDGLRWHARAYCHIEQKFKDFLLPRATAARSPGEPGKSGTEDFLWNEHVVVEIGPHPRLTASQQKIVAKDYGMRAGFVRISVRYAMLFYVLRRLGLLGDAENADPRTQHIVVLNKDVVQSALRRSGYYGEESGSVAGRVAG